MRVYDPRKDGQCGFRAIAHSLGLQSNRRTDSRQDGWYDVRSALVTELQGSQFPNYHKVFGTKTEYNKALKRLQVPSKSAWVGQDKWMSRCDICQLVPNAYGRPFIILGEDNVTYLPNRNGPQSKGDSWPIVLVFVDNNHWVALEMNAVGGMIPFPPHMNGWNQAKNTRPEALKWKEVLQGSFPLWASLEIAQQ